jgi:hypothetical protein
LLAELKGRHESGRRLQDVAVTFWHDTQSLTENVPPPATMTWRPLLTLTNLSMAMAMSFLFEKFDQNVSVCALLRLVASNMDKCFMMKFASSSVPRWGILLSVCGLVGKRNLSGIRHEVCLVVQRFDAKRDPPPPVDGQLSEMEQLELRPEGRRGRTIARKLRIRRRSSAVVDSGQVDAAEDVAGTKQ